MFGKKLLATMLSLGILSVCSMGALARTVSGTGYSSGGNEVDFSITTKCTNTMGTITSKMKFWDIDMSAASGYITSIIYLKPENPSDPLIPYQSNSSTDTWIQDDPDYRGWQQCVVTNEFCADIVTRIESTFHYDSPVHGSFVVGLIKYGCD